MNVSQRIMRLRRGLHSRKASYPIAASLVRFRISVSEVWSVSGGNHQTLKLRVRFKSSNPKVGIAFVNLIAQVAADGNFSEINPRVTYHTEPQAGDGTAIINISIGTSAGVVTYYVRAIASGAVDGTFERIQ